MHIFLLSKEKIGIRTQATVELVKQYKKIENENNPHVHTAKSTKSKISKKRKVAGGKIAKPTAKKRQKRTENDEPVAEQELESELDPYRLRKLLPKPVDEQTQSLTNERCRLLLDELKASANQDKSHRSKEEIERRRIYRKKLENARTKVRQAKIRDIFRGRMFEFSF